MTDREEYQVEEARETENGETLLTIPSITSSLGVENSMAANPNSDVSQLVQMALNSLQGGRNPANAGGKISINLHIHNFSGNFHINGRTGGQITEDPRHESQELLDNFLQDELESEELTVPVEVEELLNQDDNTRVPRNTAQLARRLRRLANEFARTSGRDRVRREANNFMRNLENITLNEIQEIINHVMFVDHRNPMERVVTLFFFCCDIVTIALKSKLYQVSKQIVLSAIQFIVKKISSLVARNGGWNAVLGSVTREVTLFRSALVVAGLGIAGGVGYYLWKFR